MSSDSQTSSSPARRVLIVGVVVCAMFAGFWYATAHGKTSTSVTRTDRAASRALVIARQRYVRAANSRLTVIETAQDALTARVGHSCTNALSDAYPGPRITEFAHEVIGTLHLIELKALSSAAEEFASEARWRRWTNPRIARDMRALLTARRRLGQVPLPNICRDARDLARSRARRAAPGTSTFIRVLNSAVAGQAAEGPGTLEAEIWDLIARYQDARERLAVRDIQRSLVHAGQDARKPSAWTEVLSALGVAR